MHISVLSRGQAIRSAEANVNLNENGKIKEDICVFKQFYRSFEAFHVVLE